MVINDAGLRLKSPTCKLQTTQKRQIFLVMVMNSHYNKSVTDHRFSDIGLLVKP